MPLGKSFETNGSAASRTWGIPTPLPGLHSPRAKPVAQSPLIIGPAFIARPTEPRVELILNSALDDQSGAELREPRERLSRVLTNPHGEQLVDLIFNLRRRRYGTSHGVGLLHRLCRT
jgi:hypothetical protein